MYLDKAIEEPIQRLLKPGQTAPVTPTEAQADPRAAPIALEADAVTPTAPTAVQVQSRTSPTVPVAAPITPPPAHSSLGAVKTAPSAEIVLPDVMTVDHGPTLGPGHDLVTENLTVIDMSRKISSHHRSPSESCSRSQSQSRSFSGSKSRLNSPRPRSNSLEEEQDDYPSFANKIAKMQELFADDPVMRHNPRTLP